MELVYLFLGGLAIAIGIEWLKDPEKAADRDILRRLFFPDGDPSKLYFLLIRVTAVLLILAGAAAIVAAFMGYTT